MHAIRLSRKRKGLIGSRVDSILLDGIFMGKENTRVWDDGLCLWV